MRARCDLRGGEAEASGDRGRGKGTPEGSPDAPYEGLDTGEFFNVSYLPCIYDICSLSC
jgi:hypothetical protein